jgi:uncharacterized membrane protein YcjF (UPF0283 family)
MTQRDTVIMVVKIAAVLIVACLIGLLIRQARIRHLDREATARQKALAEKAITQQSPGGRRPVDDQKRRAELQKQRDQARETVNKMTDEEKAKMVENEVRSRMGASGRPPSPRRAARTNPTIQPSTAPVAPEPNTTTDGKH